MVRLLADVAPEVEVYLFDQTFSLRSQFAVNYGNALAWWGMVEARLSDLFIGALGVRAKPALAALSTLSSTEARHSSIFAAVAETLRTKREKEVFREVQKQVLLARRERNILAHWIWCISTELPDDLIAVNPNSWLTQGGTSNIIDISKPCKLQDLGSDAKLYGWNEFFDLLDLMSDAALTISMMRHLVMMKDSATRRDILTELEALPCIEKSLKQSRDSRKKLKLSRHVKGKKSKPKSKPAN